jgi:hypothetical protein
MENKKSFILYCDLIHTVNKLPDETAGKLLKHILAYVNDLNPETDDILVEVAFEPIKQAMKRDLKKWETELERKSQGAILGNLKRWHFDLYEKVDSKELTLEEAQTIAKGRIPSHTDKTDGIATKSIASIADSVNVNVSDNVSVNVNEIKKNIFSPIVEDVFNFSLDFFPENLHPKTQKEIDSWKTTIKQLHEIDGHDYDTIRHLIQKTREDDFWSKNFLSVNKLRKNDKNGVKYFDVFFEKFKIGNNGKQGTDFAHLIRISEQFRKKPNVG